MITMQELAAEQNVSYEAIRKCVSRYKAQLDGHIEVKNRKWYIDDEGADFIRSKRQESPVVLFDRKEKDELKAAKDEAEKLRAALLEAQNKIMGLQESLLVSKEHELQTIAERAKYEALIETQEKRAEELQEARDAIREKEGRLLEVEARLKEAEGNLQQLQTELKEAETKRQEAEQEAGSFQRGLFGFYRKKG